MTYQRTPFFFTADCVVINPKQQVLLIKRRPQSKAFPNFWALPGGHVEPTENGKQAALRELKEETGLVGKDATLIGEYSDPNRDPRGSYVSVAYYVEVENYDAQHGDDAVELAWYDLDKLPLPLAFDHEQVLRDTGLI